MMDLYEMDLSLFGGDLLVGLQPTSAELKAAQDGQKSADLTTSSWATTDLAVSLGQDELANSPSLSTPMVNQTLDVSWMDSRVDLLDLLAQEGEFALEASTNMVAVIPGPTEEDQAIKVLQDMAEETSQMLAAGTTEEAPALDQAVVAQAATDTLQTVVDIEGAPTSVDHLLDMLTGGVDPSINVLDTTDGPMPMTIDSDILTTVTAEDLESILSSEPSSPAAPKQSSPYNELPPEQSNSLLAKYLIGDIGTAQSSDAPVSPSFDISDLDSFTSDVQSDDDSDYVPSPSYHVSKTRSTPYSRSKPKSGAKSKATVMDKEARTLDRKLRKKQQNKDAATRYRQKKREEADLIDRECDELEERNGQLKDKVEQMTREIGYLKNLLAEVYKARGLMAPKLGK